MQSILRGGLFLLCAAVAIANLVPPASADEAPKQALEKTVSVDIPAQPLASALSLLSQQSGVEVQVPAGLAGDRNTAGVHGSMPLRDALSALLQGSALGFHAAGSAVAIDSALAASEPPPTRSASLAEIVVTATKREESSRKIPATIDVLTGKNLEDIGARDMEDFLKYVPGITLQEGDLDSNRTLSIRGIGPQPGANTTVGELINDVAMGDPYSSYLVPDLDPYDMHDIEVLKGPQGTLFGASALNGAIRYVLNKPLLGDYEFKGFADWQHFQGAQSGNVLGGAINIPLGDTLAVRGVDVVQKIPGLYDDYNANGKHLTDADSGYKRMYRVLATWQPIPEFSADAFYLHQENHKNDLSIANNLDGEFLRTDTPGPSTSTQHFSVANLDLHYNFPWFSVVSETSHTTKLQDIDYDASAVVEALATKGIPTLRTYSLVGSESLSQEVRLVSTPEDGPWTWIAGYYYSRYSATLVDNIYLADTAPVATLLDDLHLPSSLIGNLAPSPQGLSVIYITYQPLQAAEESLFGEITRKFWGDYLQVNLGGRLYHEHLLSNVGTEGVTGLYGVAEHYTGDKLLSAKGFNPKASLTSQITENLMWYATAAHGFQFGGLNAPAPLPEDNTFPQIYKSSTIWSYETGERLDLFHKSLQVDATIFELNWTNMQLQQTTPDGVTTYTENIGAARSKGIESSIRWATPLDGLTLTNTGSYIHAKVAAPYKTSNGVLIPVGFDLPAAPRLQDAVTLAYNTRLGPVRTGAGVTLSHQGHAFNDIEHDTTIYRYNTVSFNYNLQLPHLPLSPEFTLNATNLTNTHALIGAQVDHVLNASDGQLGAFVRPRAIDLRITGHF